jgi:rhodanese-related sulfurtransferase
VGPEPLEWAEIRFVTKSTWRREPPRRLGLGSRRARPGCVQSGAPDPHATGDGAIESTCGAVPRVISNLRRVPMAELPLEVTCQDVVAKQAAGEAFLFVDCREPDEYATAKIPGTTLLPMSVLAERVGELEPPAGCAAKGSRKPSAWRGASTIGRRRSIRRFRGIEGRDVAEKRVRSPATRGEPRRPATDDHVPEIGRGTRPGRVTERLNIHTREGRVPLAGPAPGCHKPPPRPSWIVPKHSPQ